VPNSWQFALRTDPEASSQKQDNQDDQENGSKATADIGAAVIKSAATEQEQQDDDQDDQVHSTPSMLGYKASGQQLELHRKRLVPVGRLPRKRGFWTPSVPAQNEPEHDADAHRRQQRRHGLVAREFLQIVDSGAIGLLRLASRLVDLAPRLRGRIAGQAANRILHLPANIAGCALKPIFVHFCVPHWLSAVARYKGQRRSADSVPAGLKSRCFDPSVSDTKRLPCGDEAKQVFSMPRCRNEADLRPMAAGGEMPLRWMTVVMVAALQAVLVACSPSPQGLQPADPLAGAGAVELHLGGCSPATSPCPQ
jgi:hypothetical protein